MKPLSTCLESLLDDDDIFLDPKNDKKDIENRIENWIKNNYFISGKLTISDDFVVDCSGGVSIKNNNITSLTNGLFRWGKVKNYFECSYCKTLTSLEGAPEKVDGGFDCKHCEKLTSLKGAPNEVGGDFNCSSCNNLKTLEGSPKSVGGDFDCNSCIKLESLKGGPKAVDWIFRCDFCDNLKSLKGAPEHVGWVFQCNYCKKLKVTDSEREKYRLYI